MTKNIKNVNEEFEKITVELFDSMTKKNFNLPLCEFSYEYPCEKIAIPEKNNFLLIRELKWKITDLIPVIMKKFNGKKKIIKTCEEVSFEYFEFPIEYIFEIKKFLENKYKKYKERTLENQQKKLDKRYIECFKIFSKVKQLNVNYLSIERFKRNIFKTNPSKKVLKKLSNIFDTFDYVAHRGMRSGLKHPNDFFAKMNELLALNRQCYIERSCGQFTGYGIRKLIINARKELKLPYDRGGVLGIPCLRELKIY